MNTPLKLEIALRIYDTLVAAWLSTKQTHKYSEIPASLTRAAFKQADIFLDTAADQGVI